MRTTKYDYDAFISHAVEDKIPIANELCARLEAAGLKIWYSGKELGVGDSIEKTIEKGLNRSRYGIVIFSPTYLAKNWTIREFYTLLAKEIREHKVILPVLYNVTLDELRKKDLLMADRFAVNADKGLDVVVERLVSEIRKSGTVAKTRRPWLSRIGLLFSLSLLANAALLYRTTRLPDAEASMPLGHSFEFASARTNIDHAAVLITEMQTLLREANHCRCQRQAVPTAVNGRSSDIPPASGGQGRKMTMALVFQMELPENSPGQRSENADPSERHLDAPEEPVSFIAVNGPAQERRTDCGHTVVAGE